MAFSIKRYVWWPLYTGKVRDKLENTNKTVKQSPTRTIRRQNNIIAEYGVWLNEREERPVPYGGPAATFYTRSQSL